MIETGSRLHEVLIIGTRICRDYQIERYHITSSGTARKHTALASG